MPKKLLFALMALFVISFASFAQDNVPQVGLHPQSQGLLTENGFGEPDITVDSTTDTVDANPGDGFCEDTGGQCTLRAAIMEANAFPLTQTIYVPAGTYLLTIPGTDEDAAATGDLDITDGLLIIGAGQGETIIDGNDIDRVFHVHDPSYPGLGEIVFSNMTIQGGNAPYGGGILAETEALVSVRFSTLRDNYAYGHYPCGQSAGAALYSKKTSASLMYSTVTENRTPDTNLGSSYGAVSGIIEIWASSIVNNQTDWAVIVDQDTCDVEETTFWILFSLIANNDGGGLRFFNPMSVSDSTITGNAAGIQVSYAQDPVDNAFDTSIDSTTIAENGNVGLIIDYPVSVDLTYTIISGHTQDCDVSGAVAIDSSFDFDYAEYNIFSDASCPTDATDSANTDPLLFPLADNGGFTATRALPELSPATDVVCHGSGSDGRYSDQRGVLPEGVTRCSIGAFEYFEYSGPNEPFAPAAGDVIGSDIGVFNQQTPPTEFALSKYLYMSFSGHMYNPPGDSDPEDITNPANYELIKVDTNESVPITRIIYGEPWPVQDSDYLTAYHYGIGEAVIEVDAQAVGGTPYYLPEGDYVLTISPNVRDIKGVYLDGDSDGYSGGDHSTSFTQKIVLPQVAQINVYDGNPTPSATLYPNAGSIDIPAYVDFIEVEFAIRMDSYQLIDLGNIRLIQGGSNGIVETNTCDALAGDDALISIADVKIGEIDDYDGHFIERPPFIVGRYTVDQSLSANAYRLILCDEITSLEDVPLDGDFDEIPGGDFMLNFVVDGFIPPLPTPAAPTLNDYSDVLVALNLPTVSDVPDGTVMQIERTTGGSASIVGSVDVGTATFVDSNLICETAYRYRVRLYDASENQFSVWSDYLDITTANCVTSLQHTFGLYKEGQWLFYAVDGYQRDDVRFQFGPAEPGWTALVGDWNGDGMPGIGLYKNGTFMLRDLDGTGVADVSFDFGPPTGAVPIVGDWDGNGSDTIGVFVGGTFFLRNSNDTGAADLTFSRGSASSQPLAGDWDGDGTDSVGYFENNIFNLATSGASPTIYASFSFGPMGWSPVFGDWNGDLTDTIGLYNNGLWRLRNSNSAGVVDYGFSYGNLEGSWQPVGNFDSSPAVLNLLFAATVPTPRVPVIPGPSISTPTEAALDGYPPAYNEMPIEPTPLASMVPTMEITLTPEPRSNALSTATAVPSFTPEPMQTEMVPQITPSSPTSTSE